MKDDIVPFSLGEQLYNMTNSSYEPWYVCLSVFIARWVPDAHHNDIVYTHEKEYYDRLGVFVSSCLSRYGCLLYEWEKDVWKRNETNKSLYIESHKANLKKEKYRMRGLNSRPLACEASVITTTPTRPVIVHRPLFINTVSTNKHANLCFLPPLPAAGETRKRKSSHSEPRASAS